MIDQNAARKTITAPENDPNALQARAADPGQSVWVAASAGSGKTKVLTDRVLRLLLPQTLPDGQFRPGTPAEKILCLTFTKAGAAEMSTRITKALGSWAVMEEADLYKNLGDLLSRNPAPVEMEAARRLFAQVIDSPGGLKILTIHSFCQSVLGRFPLEAGLSPQVSVADENTVRPLQQAAMAAVLAEAEDNPDSGLHAALHRLSAEKGEGDLMTLLMGLMGERARISALFRAYPDAISVYDQLCRHLGLNPGDTPDSILLAGLSSDVLNEGGLRHAVAAMAGAKTKSMQEAALPLQTLIDAPPPQRADFYKAYSAVFLTADGEIRKRLTTKEIPEDVADIMRIEAERVFALEDRIKAASAAVQTQNLLRIGAAMMRHYTAAKKRDGVLDYDDLIAHTLSLLSGESMNTNPRAAAQWVMFKLDQGIDHILVDEAQDTNPEQWAIIHALCGEFFAGSSAREAPTDRTIFAVGDEKQSIFGFQRAAPEKFREAERYYADTARSVEQRFDSVPMNISFRSTAAVLAVADAAFEPEGTGFAPGEMLGLPHGTDIRHISHRKGQAGLVEIWPLIRVDPAPDPEPWTPPITIEDAPSAEGLLCDQIAAKISHWLTSGEILPAYNRAVQAGDIMILVRSRGSMVERLVRSLKSANVPVSGIDRMTLGDQIAVQDLLAAAQFALLPEDDLSLACLLQSPLIGMDGDALAKLATNRPQSLWQAVKGGAGVETMRWLEQLISTGGVLHPYEFFNRILTAPCPANNINPGTNPGSSGQHAMIRRLGVECLDPLEEFLNLTLQYETDHIASLQQFLSWQAEGETTIKREMEAAGGRVRIMTVHGSKGLQAPIVILPDTAHTTGSIEKIGTADRILWMAQQNGPAIPLWSPRSEADCAVARELLTARKAKLAEEYRRLLYVALTRAADRLYVAGCAKKNDPSDQCWYKLVEAGFARIEQGLDPDFTLEPLTAMAAETGATIPGFRLSNAQIAAPDRAAKSPPPEALSAQQFTPQPALPAQSDWSWVHRAPAEEDSPPRPWTPSRPSDPAPAARSPLHGGEDQYRFRRGNVTHTLLQFLPSLNRAEWERAAAHYVSGQDLSPAIQAEIVSETMAILNDPAFTAVFGPGSMAEVPITALIDKTLISGQIDRLLVTPDSILIVDYKTNRPAPTDVKDVPALYRTQLRAYRDTLAKIYPGRTIRCALLWTDGPRMMEIEV